MDLPFLFKLALTFGVMFFLSAPWALWSIGRGVRTQRLAMGTYFGSAFSGLICAALQGLRYVWGI